MMPSVKNRLFAFLILTACLFGTGKVYAQEISTEGTDFWLGFMENFDDADLPSSLELFITAREETSGIITIPGVDPVSFTVRPGETFKHVVSEAFSNPFAASRSGRVENKGIHVQSDKNVSLYAFNRRRFSADATIILPTPALGSQYYVASYFEEVTGRDPFGTADSQSQFLIVGIEDNTVVRYRPTVRTLDGREADQFHEVTLNQGEIFQVQAYGDLTGTLVETVSPQDACTGQKFAVFGGNKWTRIANGNAQCLDITTADRRFYSGGFAGDHLFEQMFPVTTWGREFTVMPFELRPSGYLLQFTASQDNTVITINGNQEIQLAEAGDVAVYDTTEPVGVVSNHPIQVNQLSKSLSCDQPFNQNGPGDPFMMLISPNEQTFKEVTFNALESDVIDNYFLNIVVPTDEVDQVRMNGVSISSRFSPFVSNTEISVAIIELNRGQDVTLISEGQQGFIAYIYGFGAIESFGYVAGTGLSNLDLQIVRANLEVGAPEDQGCINTQIDFLAEFDEDNVRVTPFERFSWNFGDGTQSDLRNPTHTFTAPGTYTISLYAEGGEGDCFVSTTVSRDIEIQEVLLPEIEGETSICLNVESYSYEINANPEYSLLWGIEGGSITTDRTQRSVDVIWDSSEENHRIYVTAENDLGCTLIEELPVIMNSLEPLEGSVIVQNVLCNGESSGSAEVVITGGTAPYQVDWSGGRAVDRFVTTGLAEGSYDVTVTDANDCNFSLMFDVTEPDPLAVSFETVESCMNEPTGAAFLVATGGEEPYTFLWEPNVANGEEATELSAGNYQVTVVDRNGCQFPVDLEITPRRPRVTVPNIFTPNGNGDPMNETFAPVFECYQAITFDMKIYNRWGNLVYHTNSVDAPWDGTHLGEPSERGTYNYKIAYSGEVNGRGFNEILHGYFKLER